MTQRYFPKTSLRWLAGLIAVVMIIRLAAGNSWWVENAYSSGFYGGFAQCLRRIFGWLPFSIGDCIYLFAGLWIAFKITRMVLKIIRRQMSWRVIADGVFQIGFILLILYIVFNVFWGLNYDRKGIISQMKLEPGTIDTASLKIVNLLLLEKLNESKTMLMKSRSLYPSNQELFERALTCYRDGERQFPFLRYHTKSVKSSLFGWLGNYLGFTGYYNPFTGEAQINTTVPAFIRPYTTVHEMAHQLGYAKEEEANFVGYLVATASNDTLFHYSTYLDLFIYANRVVYLTDSMAAKSSAKLLLPEVKADIREWRDFLKSHRNPLEPMITWVYGNYLRLNRQPKGMFSYNEVIVDLIAYYKKFGKI